jgi:hypothetical protein
MHCANCANLGRFQVLASLQRLAELFGTCNGSESPHNQAFAEKCKCSSLPNFFFPKPLQETLLNLLVRFGRWNCPCHSTTLFLQHCVIEFLNSVFQFLLRINPLLLHQDMIKILYFPFLSRNLPANSWMLHYVRSLFLEISLWLWRELFQLWCALSVSHLCK